MTDVDEQKIFFGNERFLRIFKTIEEAETLQELLASVPSLIPEMIATYRHFNAVGACDVEGLTDFHTYSVPQVMQTYLQNYRRPDANPVIVAVLAKGEAAWLTELMDHPHILKTGHDRHVRAAMDLLGDALCIPLYGPNSRTGYILLAFGFGKADCDEFIRYRIQSAAQKFHVLYCLMLRAMHLQVKLTPREAEVLELISFGKTNAEIGKILGISANTVSGYVKQIFLKLDVTDRVSAAMRAQTLKIEL